MGELLLQLVARKIVNRLPHVLGLFFTVSIMREMTSANCTS